MQTLPPAACLILLLPDPAAAWSSSCSVLHGLLLMKLMTQSRFTNDPAVTYGGASVISTAQGDRVYYVSAGNVFCCWS